jgi:hypothetical protein
MKLYLIPLCLIFSACSSSKSWSPTPIIQHSRGVQIQEILSHSYECPSAVTIRSQALTPKDEKNTCEMLNEIDRTFHAAFSTDGKPVKHDLNTRLRANIYKTEKDFKKYAPLHFNMPINNGGMYLEGTPDESTNHAEFVANQQLDGSIRNLTHEYVHYLDGRFNLYGDFCAGLHDSHDAPENCARPAPMTPYLVWWTEGIAEYISKGKNNPPAIKKASAKSYTLSQLFNTGYVANNGEERIYTWGYLAARFMMENQRDKVERMLAFTRSGDYPRYQALVRSWGTSMDDEFSIWLLSLETTKSTSND